MRLTLTREQRIADRCLRSFDLVRDRLASCVTGLERAESSLHSVTAIYGAYGSGGAGGDKILNAMCAVERAADDMRRYAEGYAKEFADVEGLISEVQRRDSDAGRVLRLTYIDGSTAAEVAEATGIQRKRVYECLRRGLDEAFEVLGGADVQK